MNIEPLVRKTYPVLDVYCHADMARRHPEIDEGIVLTENNLPIALITSKDLADKNYALLFDFVRPKPTVPPTEKITKVLEIMKVSGYRVLMTRDQDGLTGIISQTDLLDHFHKRLNKQQHMLQAVAHDLRSPLASIRMLGQLLVKNLQKEENREIISVIDKACDQGETILQDILFSESLYAESLSLSLQDFDALVADCIKASSALIQQKNLLVHSDLQAGRRMPLDESKFRRVINNLLHNAVKFSMPGTTITIKTYVKESTMLLEVTDQGIGIKEENLEKIFDKFTGAKRAGTNGEYTTGLGLHITRQIVTNHNGTISAYSDGKTGSTFQIKLPIR